MRQRIGKYEAGFERTMAITSPAKHTGKYVIIFPVACRYQMTNLGEKTTNMRLTKIHRFPVSAVSARLTFLLLLVIFLPFILLSLLSHVPPMSVGKGACPVPARVHYVRE